MNKATLKSKTFWGFIAFGIWNALHMAGITNTDVYNIGNTVIVTLTGVAAVDRSTKIINK